MFQKNLRLAYLLDFYREILDEHTRSIMCAYYEDDLSLAEIAEDVGISRQGVRHVIKKAEDEIEFLESKLHIAEQFEKTTSAMEDLHTVAEALMHSDDAYAKEASLAIEKAIEKIRDRQE